MAHINSDPVHSINADIIHITGHTVVGNEIDVKTDSSQDIRFNQDVISTGSIRSDLYATKSGDLWCIPNSNSIGFQKPVNFGNNAISGIAGISLTASQIQSSNYNGQTLDHELDLLTTAQNTILGRTQGLTANRLAISNNAGILATGSLIESNLNTLSGNQTISGNKTHSGDIIIDDLTASRLVLSDGSKKLVSGIAENTINILAGNQTISGNKTHSGDITINDLTASKLVVSDSNKKLVSSVALSELAQLDSAPVFTGIVRGASFKQGASALNFSHLAGSVGFSAITGSVADSQLSSNVPLKTADIFQTKSGELVNTMRTVSDTTGDNSKLTFSKILANGNSVYENFISAYNTGQMVYQTSTATGHRWNIDDGTQYLKLTKTILDLKAGMLITIGGTQIDSDDLSNKDALFHDDDNFVATGQCSFTNRLTVGLSDDGATANRGVYYGLHTFNHGIKLIGETNVTRVNPFSTAGNLNILGGSKLKLKNLSDLEVESGADLIVKSGGDILIDSGGVLTNNGTTALAGTSAITANMTISNNASSIYSSGSTITLNSGSDLACESGADVIIKSGGDILLLSGAVLTNNGTTALVGTSAITGNMTISNNADFITSSGSQTTINSGGILEVLDGGIRKLGTNCITKINNALPSVSNSSIVYDTAGKPAFIKGFHGEQYLRSVFPASLLATNQPVRMRFDVIPIENDSSVISSNYRQSVTVDTHNSLQPFADDGTARDARHQIAPTYNITRDGTFASSSLISEVNLVFNDGHISGSNDHKSVFIKGCGYINWGHSGWGSHIQGATNKFVRLGVKCSETVRVLADGQPVGTVNRTSGDNHQGISSGSTAFQYHMFPAKGDYTTIEVVMFNFTRDLKLDFEVYPISYWNDP